MTEMVERVARAIRESEEWSSFWGEEESLVLARAAIEAMREPTNKMLAAAMAETATDLTAEYRAMIDAALVQAVNASENT